MATVNVVCWLSAQADWLGPKVGGHWRCVYRVGQKQEAQLLLEDRSTRKHAKDC